MNIRPSLEHRPEIDESCYIDPACGVSGDVSLAISDVEQVADGLKAVTPDEYENIHLGVVSARRIFADHGIPLGGDVSPYQLTAAIAANDTERLITLTTTTAVVGALALGLFLAFIRIKPRLRARNSVERVVLTLLIAASIPVLYVFQRDLPDMGMSM